MKKIAILFMILFASTYVFAQGPKLKPIKEKYMGMTIVPFQKKDKWGYAITEDDKKPKIVIKTIFEEARPFYDGTAVVKWEGKYYFIKNTGEIVPNMQYDSVRGPIDGRYSANVDNIHYSINSNGNIDSSWEIDNSGNLEITKNGIKYKMIRIPQGKFYMGVKENNRKELDYDCKIHEVELSNDYFIGETEITQQLWLDVMSYNPSKNIGLNNPVENVSWKDCNFFVEKFKNITGLRFRLPTEAEWEYAASSCGKEKSVYSGSKNIDEIGWFVKNSQSNSHPVKSKKSNSIGLFDMSGNIAEWCNDWYNSNYYNVCPLKDPIGPTSGKGKVVRGGSWNNVDLYLRVSNRISHAASYKSEKIGLRIVLDTSELESK